MWRNVFSWQVPAWQQYRNEIVAFLKKFKKSYYMNVDDPFEYEDEVEYQLHLKRNAPYCVAVFIDLSNRKQIFVKVWSSYVDHENDDDECDKWDIERNDGDSYPHDTSNMKQFPIEDITSITAYINELARRRQ